MATLGQDDQKQRFRDDFEAMRRQMGVGVVGQEDAVEALLTAILAGGHVLLEGPPGVGKTLLARSLAAAVGLSFQRIQGTADLMPADVLGTHVVMENPQGRRVFDFRKGPIFANLVLADQVNRAPPKTQSALLEAMEDGAITVSTESFRLPQPHLIVATQNPWEMEGTYPLPEAQVDRFFFKVLLGPLRADQLEQILDRAASEPPAVQTVVDGARLLAMAQEVRQVSLTPAARRWCAAVVSATHPQDERAPDLVRRYVRAGASPRGAVAMVLAAKVRAILAGRSEVSCAELRGAARLALRHRILVNFEGLAQAVSPEAILDAVLESAP